MLFAAPISILPANSSIMHAIDTNRIFIAATIFIIAAITDKLDGYIARKYNQVTKFGALVDPLADKLMVATALILLVQQNKVAAWAVLIILGREFAVTSLRIIAAFNKKVLAADKYGKIKLVFQVVTIPLCLLNNYPLNLIIDIPFSSIMMILTVIITIFSGVNYFVKNKDVFYENGQLII
jgi:CDP-diacylglycerol--glycerol-3-phosphate 3-phosphatidyltransferase